MNEIIPSDLATYLGAEFDAADTARCQMLIDGAVAQALSIVTVGTVPDTGPTVANLPAGVESILHEAIARKLLNVRGSTSQMAGSFMDSAPAPSGSMFSAKERAALRRAAGRAGAFSIDTLAGGWWETTAT